MEHQRHGSAGDEWYRSRCEVSVPFPMLSSVANARFQSPTDRARAQADGQLAVPRSKENHCTRSIFADRLHSSGLDGTATSKTSQTSRKLHLATVCPDSPLTCNSVMHYSVIAGWFGDHMLMPPGKFFTMFHFLVSTGRPVNDWSFGG